MFTQDSDDDGDDETASVSRRDRLKVWFEQKGMYAVSQRLAMVPEAVLIKIDRKPINVALEILEKEGY